MGIHHLLSYNIRIKHVSEVNLYETETNPLPVLRQHRNFKGCVLWLNHIFTKSEAYRWIADKFCLTAKEAHIGEFSTYMCDQLILESMKILENNHIPLRAIG